MFDYLHTKWFYSFNSIKLKRHTWVQQQEVSMQSIYSWRRDQHNTFKALSCWEVVLKRYSSKKNGWRRKNNL